jgi:phosphotransacetylase
VRRKLAARCRRGRGSRHHCPVLVGPASRINGVARDHNLDIGRLEVIDVAHSEAGSLHTDELMKAVTASSTGLRTARRISHVFIMDVPTYPEPLFITDAAINIFPDLDAKRASQSLALLSVRRESLSRGPLFRRAERPQSETLPTDLGPTDWPRPPDMIRTKETLV